MIVLLALFSATVLEFPQPNADRIVVEAVVRTGRLDPREEAAADLLALTLRSGTANLTRGQLLQYGTMAGERMRVQRLPDSFRIGLTVPRGNLETAAVLLDELLRYATFDEGPVKATLDELPFRKPEPWLEALRPFRFEYAKLEREDVLDLYRKAFRPEHTTVAVWGGFAPGEAKSHFEDRWQDWKALPIAKRFRPSLNRTRAETRPHSLSTIELEGPEFRGADGDFAAKLLAAFALGGGKWSSMHRILREKQAWTYRQEAVL
ncbi:MAG TPA: insulinase family protein, partial [Fimbriimonadaceae bacterium]|nr:insulinase family protein [Fimbriimonadaceae bacterium]